MKQSTIRTSRKLQHIWKRFQENSQKLRNTCTLKTPVGWLTVERYSKRHVVAQIVALMVCAVYSNSLKIWVAPRRRLGIWLAKQVAPSVKETCWIDLLGLCYVFICIVSLLKTKWRQLHLKVQFVPRCKHFSSRLQKPLIYWWMWHKSLFVLRQIRNT
jgi:hypothetical protein